MLCCPSSKKDKTKKHSEAVYEATPVIPKQQASLLYPSTAGQMKSRIEKITDKQLQDKKKYLAKQKGEIIRGKNQYSALKQYQRDSEKPVKLKKIEKCGYDIGELHSNYIKKKKQWTDKDFPYENIKLGPEKTALWKRTHQFIDKPELFPPEVSPNDVIQGALNDCYFLSAVSALAQRPYRIDELFVTKQYNPAGFYVCKLNFNGVHQQVIVDDLFPVAPDAPHRPLYAQPARGKYIWVMVLEKCWAKLLRGYNNCNYGYTNEAFQSLTGAPTLAYLLWQYRQVDPNFDKLFNLLKESTEKGYVMQVSRGNANSYQQSKKSVTDEGLPMSHAYSLLGAYETKLKNGKDVKLLQIRNPWGTTQSKLTWNDNDPLWDQVYPEEKEHMQYRYNKNDNDGVFYMDWKDFTSKFENLFSICQINDEANYTFLHLTAQDRKPIYLEVQTNGHPEEVGIYFVQQMQEHFKDQYKYSGVSVVISRVKEQSNGETILELVGTYNYYNTILDNYFTLPIRKARKGKYLFRIYIWWPERSDKKQPLVAGVYSSAIFSVKEVTKEINDGQFIEQNCRTHAWNLKDKQMIKDDPHSWLAVSKMENTNYGYILFHYGQQSKVKNYKIKVDETKNQQLYFLLDYLGKDKFEIDCDPGYEYLIVFAYSFSEKYDLAMNKNLYPSYDPKFRLPQPEVIPY